MRGAVNRAQVSLYNYFLLILKCLLFSILLTKITGPKKELLKKCKGHGPIKVYINTDNNGYNKLVRNERHHLSFSQWVILEGSKLIRTFSGTIFGTLLERWLVIIPGS